MRISRRMVWVLCFLFSMSGPLWAQEVRGEASAKKRIARQWTTLASLAVKKKSKPTAIFSLEQLAKYQERDRAFERLEGRIRELEDGPDDAAVLEKREKVVAKVASALEKLAKTKKAPTAAASRLRGYLLEAVLLEPEKRLEQLRELGAVAAENDDLVLARKLLDVARKHDAKGLAEGKHGAAEGTIGRLDRLVLRADGHPMEAILILPRSWKPETETKLVLYIDGAGSDFDDAVTMHRREVGRTQFAILIPKTFSNANEIDPSDYPYEQELLERFREPRTRPERMKWDVEGIDAILENLRARFRFSEKLMMTGYSGGGMLTHWWITHRPTTLAAAALGSANFYQVHVRGGVVNYDDGGPAIRLFTGTEDSVGTVRIFPQNDEALAYYRQRGIDDVAREHLKGRQHEPFTKLVFAFFDRVAEAGR